MGILDCPVFTVKEGLALSFHFQSVIVDFHLYAFVHTDFGIAVPFGAYATTHRLSVELERSNSTLAFGNSNSQSIALVSNAHRSLGEIFSEVFCWAYARTLIAPSIARNRNSTFVLFVISCQCLVLYSVYQKL